MPIPQLDLPHITLSPGEDAELARAIEAGLYARHILGEGAADPLLERIVSLGEEASQTLTWVGVRMALKFALRTAHLAGLPADELFQDGCVAVAEAIRRYDHSRAVRFTTFVHEYLYRVMCDAGRHRMGQPMVSRADRRAARQALRQAEALGMAPSSKTMDQVIKDSGLSPGAANRGRIRLVSLDELIHTDSGYDPPTPFTADFLALLVPRHRRVLQLRHGFEGPPRTLSQVAAMLNASASTVTRWEREALAAAHRLLTGDETTTAAAYREGAAAAG